MQGNLLGLNDLVEGSHRQPSAEETMKEKIVAILGSDVHQFPTSYMNYRHWLIKLKYQMRSVFPGALLANSWIQPLKAEKGDTIANAVNT